MKVCDPCSSYRYLPIDERFDDVPKRRRISRKEARYMCIAYWKRAIEKQGAKHPTIKRFDNSKKNITTQELYDSAVNDTDIVGYGNAIDIYMYHYNKKCI